MVRTQIQLTDDQHRKLKRIAAEEGLSISEIIRRSLDHVFARGGSSRQEAYARAAEVLGRFEDIEGATDLSQHHDQYLEDGYR